MSPRLHWANLADAYRWGGNRPGAALAYSTAIDLVLSRLQHSPHNLADRLRLALYLVKAGRTGDALFELQHLGEKALRSDHLYRQATILELADDRAKALDYLHRALDAGFPKHEICNELELQKLRKDSRFIFF